MLSIVVEYLVDSSDYEDSKELMIGVFFLGAKTGGSYLNKIFLDSGDSEFGSRLSNLAGCILSDFNKDARLLNLKIMVIDDDSKTNYNVYIDTAGKIEMVVNNG